MKANQSIDFITWIFYGLPVAIVLTGLAWWMLVRLFMRDAEPISWQSRKHTEEVSTSQRWTVLIILAVTLFLWLSSPFHSLSASAVSAVPLVFLPLTGILKGEDIRSMGWDTLLLVAGGLSLGTALQHTGLLDLYAHRIAEFEVPKVVFYFMLAYATMVFSNIMSNTATSTVLIPLGMAILSNNQVEVAMIIGLSASTALFLPVSTPPNAIAYSTGFIKQKDFRFGGAMVGLFGPALIILWVMLVSKII
jgi:sodium-dependent dicarboxylate transporter 2/3/5